MNISKETLEIIEQIRSMKKIIIYGAKEKGKNMLSACLNIGWGGNIEVVVTKLEQELQIDSLIGSIEVKEIKDIIIEKDTFVFVCTQENYHVEITKVLLDLGINIKNIFYPSTKLILELKKYAIFYQLKTINLDLNLLKGFSPDEVISLFYLWEPEEEWNFKSINLKMVDYLKKALIYGHTSRISS